METFLRDILPRVLPTECTFRLHSFPYKRDLHRLRVRLQAYARWLPPDWRLVLLVDRDQDDCLILKQQLDDLAAAANLRPRSLAGHSKWRLVSRIAIEELEAWYFGNWDAVCQAYPRVPATVPQRANYRDPERILKRAGTSPPGCGRSRRRGQLRRTSIHGQAAPTASPDFAMPLWRHHGAEFQIDRRLDWSPCPTVSSGVSTESCRLAYIVGHEPWGRSSVG